MARAYGQSKLAMMLTTFALARRLDGTGVVANVVHPGLVATDLVKTGGVIQLVWRGLGWFALTAEQGADTPLYAALAPEMSTVTGGYFSKRRPRRPNRLARDPAIIERAWIATQRLVSEF
jgi:NAD(P)-dependent dehydrogenase (short-subunit alcohol dehydrogenase family)